jgi:hypothetical protein
MAEEKHMLSQHGAGGISTAVRPVRIFNKTKIVFSVFISRTRLREGRPWAILF